MAARSRPALLAALSYEPRARLTLFVANDPDNAPIGPKIGEDPQLDSLEQRIASVRQAEDKRLGLDKPVVDGRSRAMHIASTMVGYPLGGFIIGAFIGQMVDRWVPWVFVALGLMFLAFFGACLQVVRLNKNA